MDRFSFDFTYLQLVVEDHMLEFPTESVIPELADAFEYNDKLTYQYLVGRHSDYQASAIAMIKFKVKQVALFLQLLRASLYVETNKRTPVFEKLRQRRFELPDFEKVENDIEGSISSIGEHLGESLDEMAADAFSSARLLYPKLVEFFELAYLECDV